MSENERGEAPEVVTLKPVSLEVPPIPDTAIVEAGPVVTTPGDGLDIIRRSRKQKYEEKANENLEGNLENPDRLPENDRERDRRADPLNGKEQSIATLRSALQKKDDEIATLRKQVQEKEQSAAELAKAKEDLQAENEKNQERLRSFEDYEAVVEVHRHPHFIELKNQREGKLGEIKALFEEYQVPFENYDAALKATTRRELNEVLSNSFDELGATEARSLIQELYGIHNKIAEVEKEPAKAKESLEQLYAAAEAKRMGEVLGSSKAIARGAFDVTYNMYSGKIAEFTEVVGDTQRNEMVRSIRKTADESYFGLIQKLIQLGLKEIPVEVAQTLSSWSQMAHAMPYASQGRQYYFDEYNKLAKDTSASRKVDRPGYQYPGQTRDKAPAENVRPSAAQQLNAAAKKLEQMNGRY